MRDEASAAEVHGDEHDGEQDHEAADRVYPARCRRDVALRLTRPGHLRLPCRAFDRARRPVSQPGFEPGTKGLKVLCSTVELLAPARTKFSYPIPFKSWDMVTSRRFAKCASAASVGVTRPVSIFQTYCRWKYTTPRRFEPSSAMVSPRSSRSLRIRRPTWAASFGSPGTSGFTRAGIYRSPATARGRRSRAAA